MTESKYFARALRRDATSAERLLWTGLRGKAVEGFRFRRQVPLQGFIADFACFEARLIVEVDGATHSTAQEIAHDERRDVALKADGFVVMRVTNDDVFSNLQGILETIRLKLLELKPREQAEKPPAP